MQNIKNFKIKDITLYSILIIIFANVLLAIGINFFIVPANLIPTGLSGFSFELTVFLKHLFTGTPIETLLTEGSLNYGVVFFILNIPIIIFGFFKVGRRFVIKSLISVVAFSIISILIPVKEIIPILTTGDQFVSAIVGGIFIGVATGLMLSVGGSGGGLDIVAVFISIYKGKSFGLYTLLINMFVIILGMLMYNDFSVGVIALFHIYIITIVVDKVHNTQEKRLLIIFTKEEVALTNIIKENLYRGITIIDSKGGYSNSKNSTIMLSLSQGELLDTISLLRKADPNCIVNILKLDNVVGHFTNPYEKTLR